MNRGSTSPRFSVSSRTSESSFSPQVYKFTSPVLDLYHVAKSERKLFIYLNQGSLLISESKLSAQSERNCVDSCRKKYSRKFDNLL
jgi:hypothetical protein